SAGFKVKESLYPANLHMPEHFHDLASVSVVLKGAYTEKVGRKSRSCDDFTAVFHPPNEKHSVDFQNSDVRILNIALSSDRYRTLVETRLAPAVSRCFKQGTAALLTKRLRAEISASDDSAALSVEGLILEILNQISKPEAVFTCGPRPLWLKD